MTSQWWVCQRHWPLRQEAEIRCKFLLPLGTPVLPFTVFDSGVLQLLSARNQDADVE